MMRGFRGSLALLATGTAFAGMAAAQAPQAPARVPPGAVVQPLGPDRSAELRGYLTTLADNPRSADALVGAGRAALEMGDAEAALTFFGRAWEYSPRDARARAGMASALVGLGQPQAALPMFAEAVALGAPEAQIAGDRGLAFDLVGDPRRAQQDYTLALRGRDNAEIRRRLALSLAISGRRDAALQLIDPQLRANDRAGWRTQAFVLALTGDTTGAQRTAQSVMPLGTAGAMTPFFARLAGLSPSQKAMAVHLGRFPNGGRSTAGAVPVDVSADPGAVTLAMGGAPPAPPAPTTTTQARPETSRNRRASGFETAGRGRTRPGQRETAAEASSRRTSPPPAPSPERT
ncbi:MAG: tetratricopeptide repeat protein, partial [Allosphingosinicella sp.]